MGGGLSGPPLVGIGSPRRGLGSCIGHSRAAAKTLRRSSGSSSPRYGLILLLLALPVYYGIQDLSDDGNLTRLGNNIVEGMSNGAILALIALGYTLVYGIIELINFAHGEIFMLGSFASFALFSTFGLTPRPPRPGWSSGCWRSSCWPCSPARRST